MGQKVLAQGRGANAYERALSLTCRVESQRDPVKAIRAKGLPYRPTRAQPGFGQAMNNLDSRLSGAGAAVPIMVGEEVLGAMGISGVPGGERDEACVHAGLPAITGSMR